MLQESRKHAGGKPPDDIAIGMKCWSLPFSKAHHEAIAWIDQFPDGNEKDIIGFIRAGGIDLPRLVPMRQDRAHGIAGGTDMQLAPLL